MPTYKNNMGFIPESNMLSKYSEYVRMLTKFNDLNTLMLTSFRTFTVSAYQI